MYNSMKKSEVMEGVLFLCILARQEAQGIDIITYFLTAPLHYSKEIWAQFSPLFWASTLKGKVRWSELKCYSEEYISLILFCNLFIDVLLSKPDKLSTRFRTTPSQKWLPWTGDQSSQTLQWQFIKIWKWCSVSQGRVPSLLSIFEERRCPFHCPVMLYQNISPESVQQTHYGSITCFWVTKTEVLSPIFCQNQSSFVTAPLMKLLQCW